MTRAREILRGIPPLKATYHALRSRGLALLAASSPELLARLRYRAAWGRWPDLRDPTTFDEKLLWLNLYWRHPLKTECGDKFTLRAYVERQGLGELLPRIYGVFDSVEKIDFDALPERFVLKCTHGCKCNVFCLDKAKLHVARTRRDLKRWMATDYSTLLGELHYSGMTARIVCKEFLDDGTEELPADYKVYCFSGQPEWILCCFERTPNGKATFAIADVNWGPAGFLRDGPPGGRVVPRPAALPEILTACQILSQPFPFVRMDFYSIRGRAVLGEMTFTPDACIDTAYTDEAQQALGRRITLPPPMNASCTP